MPVTDRGASACGHNAGVWISFERHMRQPWEFTVSGDVDECRRRLEAVSTSLGNRYYWDTSNAGKPAPKLRVLKRPTQPVQVARWDSTRSQNSFVAWLSADLIPDVADPAGRVRRTTVRGWIGLHPAWSWYFPLFVGLAGLLAAVGFVTGVVGGLTGQPVGWLVALVVLAFVAAFVGLFAVGARDIRADGEQLQRDVESVLSGVRTRPR